MAEELKPTQQEKIVIGKVAALEGKPSTLDDFYFWTDPNTLLNPFDVIVVEHIKESLTFAIVEEIDHITDATSFVGCFISNDFGQLSGNPQTNCIGLNYIHARILRNSKGISLPVHHGETVRLGTKDEVRGALGLEAEKGAVVCGYIEMYQGQKVATIKLPVYVNPNYLIGPDGAHLNISGTSGLAAKTSYAMFLLNAIQQRSFKEQTKQSVAYVFLNVKGRDLLTIDEKIKDLKHSDRAMYGEMGLDLEPFRQVKYFYPQPKEGLSITSSSNVKEDVYQNQIQADKAFHYGFEYAKDKENLELLFSNVDDPQQTMDSILNYIANDEGRFRGLQSWNDFMDALREMATAGQNGRQHGNEITVQSWRKFKRICQKAIDGNPLFVSAVKDEASPPLVRLEDELAHLHNNDVYVIDIAKQSDDMQSFVFGSVMKAIQNIKMVGTDDPAKTPDRIVIFVDELNKYASSDAPKNSPIRKLILEVAARGRSLGIVLFSAEQFRSEIEKQVVGNCSTQAYGRTYSTEVATKPYEFVPKTFKTMMTHLRQGEYIVQNPTFPSLLKIKFPYPLYLQDEGDAHES